jgi:hypothetical protein
VQRHTEIGCVSNKGGIDSSELAVQGLQCAAKQTRRVLRGGKQRHTGGLGECCAGGCFPTSLPFLPHLAAMRCPRACHGPRLVDPGVNDREVAAKQVDAPPNAPSVVASQPHVSPHLLAELAEHGAAAKTGDPCAARSAAQRSASSTRTCGMKAHAAEPGALSPTTRATHSTPQQAPPQATHR